MTKISSYAEWTKNHKSSYKAALKKGWTRQIAEQLTWEVQEQVARGHWTYENCLEKAKECDSLGEWQKNHGSSYSTAFKNGWHRQIAEQLNWEVKESVAMGHWDIYENCLEKAKEYKSLAEWGKNHKSSYKASLKNGWHRQIAEQLTWEVQESVTSGHWNIYEHCLERAKEFNSLAEWKKNSNPSYKAALKNGWQRQIAEQLTWEVQESVTRGHWTYEKCLEKAKESKSLIEWQKNPKSSYKAARKKGWHRQIAAELGWKVRRA